MIPYIKDIIKSLGIVFGDIGTSPIYTLTVAFAVVPATLPNVMGILSLIVWTLIFLVTIQYAWLAMSLSSKGEGGTIVLKEQLMPLLSSKKQMIIVTLLAFLGISFFIGDGVITPAISILSAVEGLTLIPKFQNLSQEIIIVVACIISIFLFIFQKSGTERVSLAFGPIMLIWFFFIAVLGSIFVMQYPAILKAINPYYALQFMVTHGFVGFLLLSKIILCATGAEALYADMGHLGRKPIVFSWVLVFGCLILMYLGQGAFIMLHPQAHNIFYQMILYQFKAFYIPLLLLSILATVIASQAMISGIFSILYQGITTNMLPHLHVEYTSRKLMSQIYIPMANWFLLIFVLFAIINFKYSHNLANAYGLAASGTMTITAIFLTWIFTVKRERLKSTLSFFILCINTVFFLSNLYKIPYGGYWSLLIACIPLSLIIIYTSGQRKLCKELHQLSLPFFLETYNTVASRTTHIRGTAIFLAKSIDCIPTYIVSTMLTNNIIYEDNVIVIVKTLERAYGITSLFKENLAPGLRVFEINVGYSEILKVEKVFQAADINPKVIFYGVEDITAHNIIWKIYSIIKKLTPSFVQFYKFPFNKLHGVTVRIDM